MAWETGGFLIGERAAIPPWAPREAKRPRVPHTALSRTPSKMANSAMLDHRAEPNSGVGKRHHRGGPSQAEYRQ
jgi:hypothetical protein